VRDLNAHFTDRSRPMCCGLPAADARYRWTAAAGDYPLAYGVCTGEATAQGQDLAI
jgi:hypothetical protein